MEWLSIQKKYISSVLQIICTSGHYNVFRPYRPPSDRRSRGTGFVIDIEKGIIMTNAHVVENAISIVGRNPELGKRELRLHLLSICQEKDVALLVMNIDDISLLTNGRKSPAELNMKFGDSLQLHQTENVMVIGFPLGQDSIKFTTGVISGFQATIEEKEDTVDRDEDQPSFIQITAPLNPGNSGGPAVNQKGEVIGVAAAGIFLSQNVGYAIGSRVILGIYGSLIEPLKTFNYRSNGDVTIIAMPKYAFDWNRTNKDLLEMRGVKDKTPGIYVANVYPASVFNDLESGDIITSMSWEDPFWAEKNSEFFDVVTRRKYTNKKYPTKTIHAKFDDFGEVTLDTTCPRTNNGCHITLKEVFDAIPIGYPMKLIFVRNGASYVLTTDYLPKLDVYVTKLVYPQFTPLEYVIFAGICVSPLTLNHVYRDSELRRYVEGKDRYRPRLLVNQVFPETNAHQMDIFDRGTIIKEINDEKVIYVDQIVGLLQELNPTEILSVETISNKMFAISQNEMTEEDKKIFEKFDIQRPYVINPSTVQEDNDIFVVEA